MAAVVSNSTLNILWVDLVVVCYYLWNAWEWKDERDRVCEKNKAKKSMFQYSAIQRKKVSVFYKKIKRKCATRWDQFKS